MKTSYFFLFFQLIICFTSFTHAQQYKILVKENFGDGSQNPSQTPALNIQPGTTNYLPLTSLATLPDGSYALALNPKGYDNFGNVRNAWQYGLDHTTNNNMGYMMLINANPGRQGEANGAYYLYRSSTFDIPGAEYVIDFYAANLLAYDISSRYSNNFKDSRIALSVRNTPDNSGILYNNNGVSSWILPRAVGNQNYLPWQNYTVNFTLPPSYNSPALYFNFFNSDTDSSTFGNDLAIDDITIRMRVSTFSGIVFLDENADGIQNMGDQPLNGILSPTYAYVVKSNNTIVSKVQIGTDGTYLLNADNGVPYSGYNIGLKIIISSQNKNIGDILSNFYVTDKVVVSENVNGSAIVNTGIPDGILSVIASNQNASNLNIGVRALCYRPGIITGVALDTPGGITSLGRAGKENGWPMIRKGGHIVLESKTKGFVPNRLNMLQINAIPSANLVDGMMIYDTTNKCLKIYSIDMGNPSNTGWHCLTQQTCPD